MTKCTRQFIRLVHLFCIDKRLMYLTVKEILDYVRQQHDYQ
nr:MAG TPA: hypothetical protein [Caudoviricetes sp.]